MKNHPFLRISISKRLPLLICALLLTSTIIFGWISYVGVKRAALKVGQDRLLALIEQLNTMYSTSTRTYITSARSVAGQEAIKRYLQSNGKDSAVEAVKILQKLRQDTMFVQVDLFNADRKNVLNSAKEGVNIKIPFDSIVSLTSPLMPDSGRIGKLYAFQDLLCFPIVATVTDSSSAGKQNKTVIGYLVRWRSAKATPQALEQSSKLLGTGAKLYIGNDDGSLWTDMRTAVSAPPISNKNAKNIINYSRTKNDPVIAAIRPISNTHWLLSVELSQQKVLEASRRFLFWIIISGAILLILGIVAAWVMSNSITRPLKSLTHAASAIASGDYSTLAKDNRYDELGKLSHAFNAMVLQVKSSQLTLEKKMQEYKLLFEKNPMPAWIISKSTLRMIDVNEAAISQYGYSQEEFLKLNAKDLRPEEDIEKYLAYASQHQGMTNSGIWRHKKKDGTIIMVNVFADDFIYNDISARLILANDVTEKLKAEEKQKKHTEELKNSNIELERFAYVASHDLQEPLRMVSSFLNLLEEEFGKDLSETAREYIHFAVDGAARMKILVNDLLQYSRIGTNKEEFTAINLNETMDYVIRVLDEDIKKKSAVVIVNPLPVIEANKTLIGQLFINLIGNALKYHGDKPPKIEIGSVEEQDRYVFYVKDNGIGIDPKFFDKIFIIFQRLHSKSEYSGTGIGLAICKKIAEVHKGKIWIESLKDQGSTFYFSIAKKK